MMGFEPFHTCELLKKCHCYYISDFLLAHMKAAIPSIIHSLPHLFPLRTAE